MFAFAELGFPGEAAAASAPPTTPVTLKLVSDFDEIMDNNERAVALVRGSRKGTQTDKLKPHQPLVVRGEGGMGVPGGLVCTTCHHETNFDPAGVPGNPMWRLAPAEMAWQGKTLGQICIQIKDRERNGGKDMAELIKHMAEDPLVGWGWNPGAGRTPALGTRKQFGELIKAWAKAGATCP